MKITIKDIAKAAGVSTSTVSLIINGKEDKFNLTTVKNVKEAIEKLNYKPNYFAKNLNSVKSNSVGIIVPEVSNPFFAKIANKIENFFSEEGYLVFLCNSSSDKEKEERYIQEMIYRSVEGVIISSTEIVDSTLISMIEKMKIPYILIDRPNNLTLNNGVFVDDYAGAISAIEYLVSMGHKKIGCISSSDKYPNISERGRGYKSVTSKYNLKEYYTNGGELTIESGYKQAIKLLETDVTAIFACNDLMAIGVYEAAKELKKIIGKDISVVGFDDIDICKYLTPSLTTIHQPIDDISKLAVDNLIWRIDNVDKITGNIILPTTLIKRESVLDLN